MTVEINCLSPVDISIDVVCVFLSVRLFACSGVREAALCAWGGVTRACEARGAACGAQCWPPLQRWALAARTLSPGEAARLAEALALLVLPAADDRTVSDQGNTRALLRLKV